MLEAGICGQATVAVTPENTARAMGSGTLEVFATPALAALAEKTCWESVAPALEPSCPWSIPPPPRWGCMSPATAS